MSEKLLKRMLVTDATDSIYLVYSGLGNVDTFSKASGLHIMGWYIPMAGTILKKDFPELKEIIPSSATLRTYVDDEKLIEKILSKVK